jgi:hypothetical protein
MVYNFRGYPPSQGSPDGDSIKIDVRAALAFLHQHGYNRTAFRLMILDC